MKQVLQDMAEGGTTLIEAPVPLAEDGHLLIDTTVSLISTGTERMLVDFGKAGLVQKARQQPDKVRQVLEKMKTDGVMTTIDAVRSKLGHPLPLGYSNVGTVAEVGRGCKGWSVGDRVVSNGPHADVVRVPRNLCAKIPDAVSDEAASFTVVGAIGLQGIRLAQPTLGETFVVTGVGLVGLMTVQLLRAQGCRVLAIDFDPAKLALAQKFGAEICNPARGEDPIASGINFSRGAGVDGVIITASTKSNDPVSQAAHMCRKRGRIVLVGVTGLELRRSDFYEKELTFQVSCSYGPGRYDPQYEEGGQDYPLGLVRWTEQRNFEAVLDMMAEGYIDIGPLVSHRFDFEAAADAYKVLFEDKSALGMVLNYNHSVPLRHRTRVELDGAEVPRGKGVMAVLGAGNYATRVLIPAFRKAGAQLHTIVSSGGTNGAVSGAQMGFAFASTDSDAVIADPAIDTLVVATRHDSHARLTAAALRVGKHVFVEKPLALDREGLAEIKEAYAGGSTQLMVGFNRRFAPQVKTMKRLIDAIAEPKSFVMVMNAGAISPDHWTQDFAVGGGAHHWRSLSLYRSNAPSCWIRNYYCTGTAHGGSKWCTGGGRQSIDNARFCRRILRDHTLSRQWRFHFS